VVNTPKLVTAVQRNSKALSFNPFFIKGTRRFTKVSDAGQELMEKNAYGEEGEHGIFIESKNGVHAALAPGAVLDSMSKAFTSHMLKHIDALRATSEVNLYEWLKFTVTMASTDSIYGPENPFRRDTSLIKTFW
jgi:hypothetical protein